MNESRRKEKRKTRNKKEKVREVERKDRSSFTLAGWNMSVKDRII